MFENWICLEPRRAGKMPKTNVVKFSISKSKKDGSSVYGNIIISQDLLSSCNINFSDKVTILMNPENKKQIYVKKSFAGRGYSISYIGNKNNKSDGFGRISFSLEENKEYFNLDDTVTRIIKHEIINEGIMAFVDQLSYLYNKNF